MFSPSKFPQWVFVIKKQGDNRITRRKVSRLNRQYFLNSKYKRRQSTLFRTVDPECDVKRFSGYRVLLLCQNINTRVRGLLGGERRRRRINTSPNSTYNTKIGLKRLFTIVVLTLLYVVQFENNGHILYGTLKAHTISLSSTYFGKLSVFDLYPYNYRNRKQVTYKLLENKYMDFYIWKLIVRYLYTDSMVR